MVSQRIIFTRAKACHDGQLWRRKMRSSFVNDAQKRRKLNFEKYLKLHDSPRHNAHQCVTKVRASVRQADLLVCLWSRFRRSCEDAAPLFGGCVGCGLLSCGLGQQRSASSNPARFRQHNAQPSTTPSPPHGQTWTLNALLSSSFLMLRLSSKCRTPTLLQLVSADTEIFLWVVCVPAIWRFTLLFMKLLLSATQWRLDLFVGTALLLSVQRTFSVPWIRLRMRLWFCLEMIRETRSVAFEKNYNNQKTRNSNGFYNFSIWRQFCTNQFLV